jgi:hypothetical protein
MKRTTIITISMVVVLTGVLIFFLIFSMDSLVTMAVEKYGSQALDADVTLKKTQISLKSGKGTLTGLKVGNPKGFETESAFELGEISLTIDAPTITKGTVVIKEILIAAPQVTYEIGPDGSNLDALQRNATSKSGGSSDAPDDSPPADGGTKKSGKKLIIESLIIKDGKVNVSAVGLQGKKMTADLPTVRMADIGKSGGGATPEQVIKKLIDALNKAAGGAVKNLGIGKVVDEVEGVVKGAKEALETGDPAEIGKKAEEIGDAVKGLFGK